VCVSCRHPFGVRVNTYMQIALSISYLLKLSLAWKLGSTGSRPAQHTPFCTLVSARQRACSERPAVSLACLSSRTGHTVANTQWSGTHAKLFHTDGAAALGATEAASIKLCDAATESAAGVATRGSLLQTFLQQEPPPRHAGGEGAGDADGLCLHPWTKTYETQVRGREGSSHGVTRGSTRVYGT
jgi:hypothetical protein